MSATLWIALSFQCSILNCYFWFHNMVRTTVQCSAVRFSGIYYFYLTVFKFRRGLLVAAQTSCHYLKGVPTAPFMNTSNRTISQHCNRCHIGEIVWQLDLLKQRKAVFGTLWHVGKACHWTTSTWSPTCCCNVTEFRTYDSFVFPTQLFPQCDSTLANDQMSCSYLGTIWVLLAIAWGVYDRWMNERYCR